MPQYAVAALFLLLLTVVPEVGSTPAVFAPYPNTVTYDEQVLLLNIQGVLNKAAPRVLLDTSSVFWSYAPADQYWFSYLSARKGFTFKNVSTGCDIIDAFPGAINGLVMYNSSQDATRYLALTTAGVQSGLAVSDQVLAMSNWSCLAAFPVIADYRGKFIGDDLGAYEWALTNLLPNCSQGMLYSAGRSHDDVNLGGDASVQIGLDLPIANAAFIFNLSPAYFPWNGNPAYPDQAAMFYKVLGALPQLTPLFGWAEPEPQLTNQTTAAGDYVLCDAAPNLSFMSRVPTDNGFPQLPNNVHANKTLDPKKYYLTFMTNEADTPKILMALQGGAWLDPRRGQIPISWGVDPVIAPFVPALFEFYADTALANDTFFAGCSGGGYSYPWHAPNMVQYAANAGAAAQKLGGIPNVIDIWESAVNFSNFVTFGAAAKNAMFTMEPYGLYGPTLTNAANFYLPDGTPIVYTAPWFFYYDFLDSDQNFLSKLEQVTSAFEPPFFINLYGGIVGPYPPLLQNALHLQSLLSPDTYEFVGMQDAVLLARQAGRFTVERLATTSLEDGTTVAIEFEVARRNPDGDAGAASTLTATVVSGDCQIAGPASWEAVPVPARDETRQRVSVRIARRGLDASAKCELQFRDSRHEQFVRNRRV